jgi:hypothetical protein
MKKLKGLLVFVLIFISAILLNGTKSFADVVQYTDNVIPTMTSDTSPSGKASASSVYNYNGGYCPAYLAFDHATTETWSGWATAKSIYTGWLEYDFSDNKSITKYTIMSRNPVNVIGELPKNWTFEAYNEQSSQWVILDTRSNVTDWAVGVKKEFTFSNTSLYKKYRINISAIGSSSSAIIPVIGELEMMETISSPLNLTSSVDKTNVDLSWTPVTNAQYYNLKRSKTSGGYYETIASGSAINFTDKGLQPDTYYYVVSAVVSGKESANSNEVSVTIPDDSVPSDHVGNNSTLILTMTNGGIKTYDLAVNDLDTFLTWYDKKSDGTGKSYYIFNKTINIAPYLSVKEYVSFDKVSSFEVKEYNQ